MNKNNFSFKLTERRSEFLNHLNIESDLDILKHLPYRYESFELTRLDKDMHGKVVVFLGTVVKKSKLSYFKGKMSKFSFVLEEGNNEVKCPVFNRTFYYNMIELNKSVIVRGKYDYFKKEIAPLDILFDKEEINSIRPVYSLPKGVKDSEFTKLVKYSYDGLVTRGELNEIVPSFYANKYRLINRKDAYYYAHNPLNNEQIKQAYRYLKYEELLLFSLRVQFANKLNKQGFKFKKELNYAKFNKVINSLPYKLTDHQENALREIVSDLTSDKIMYRLLQGDVGMGKTLVAALSLILVASNKSQGVLMAPTDILARQHYKYLLDLSKGELAIGLLVGSLDKKVKEETKMKIKNGEYDIVVGTHALIQEGVEFKNLSYCVIDEQHRFGVNQRNSLKEKGIGVDLLLMSATPIPRTLAISLFGNMDVSIINKYPSNKRLVETKVLKMKSIKSLIAKIFEICNKNERVIIITPLIESEDKTKRNALDVYNSLNEFLAGSVKMGLLHGKMSDEEKNKVMNEFKNGDIEVIISTTVIEVGVDVKEASLIIIYDAERFGLSQLHQLRGRVGRGGQESFCYLLTSNEDEESLARLKFLEECNDGFEISRFDLSLRGPGELVGVKQAGLPPLRFANFIDDIKILDVAQKDAYDILKNEDNADFEQIIKKAIEK